jgi:hypothetical protein
MDVSPRLDYQVDDETHERQSPGNQQQQSKVRAKYAIRKIGFPGKLKYGV